MCFDKIIHIREGDSYIVRVLPNITTLYMG